MRPLKAREEREVVKGSITVWRPWHLKPLELSQGVAVSTPAHQFFAQGYNIVCMQSGTADFQYQNTYASDQGGEGTFRVFGPGAIFTCQKKDSTYYCLQIDPAWLQQFATEQFHWEKSLPHFPSHSLFDPSLSRAVRNLARGSQASASRLQQEEMLSHLLAPLLLSHAQDAGALPQLGREHPAVKRTKEYLQAHYAQEIALQDLANVAHLSPFHLARIFRQAVGLPPHAYQTQLRLAHAKTLLAQGFDVSYVAHETGFSSESHFAQHFKRNFLATPGSYRKNSKILIVDLQEAG